MMRVWLFSFLVLIDICLISVPVNAQIQEQWLTYTDPEGRFTLQYPSFLNMTSKQNRFETFDLTFSNDNSSIRGHLVYRLTSDNTSVKSPEFLKRVVDGINEVLKRSEQEYRVIEINDTKINGNYAISQATYENVYDSEYGVWNVYSFINNKLFDFVYISSPKDFENGLPTVQKMLGSIKFLK